MLINSKTKQIYAGEQLLATIETVNNVVSPYYIHTDNLGSTNVVSDNFGANVQLLDYYPFGNQRISSGTYLDLKLKGFRSFCLLNTNKVVHRGIFIEVGKLYNN
ncbi:MAG: hypothetical protein WC781_05865 [Candidatus Pacearchaeota archaeon]|jgi:hypothetical protein